MHFLLEGKPLAPDGLPALKRAYLSHGIFAVSDMGHKSGIGLQAKALFAADPESGVEVRTSGHAVYKKGTYGSFLGKGILGISEIREAVAEIADSGADFLKVINSGVVSSKGIGLVTEGGFSPEELSALNEAALSRNLRMVCHANSDPAVLDAVNAGAVSVEHGFFVSHDTLHRMAEKRVEWIPTIFALLHLAGLYKGEEQARIEKIIEGHLSSVSFAASIGVPLRIGTDSGSKGVAHGSSFFNEMRLFTKAGLTLQQVLSAACMDESEIAKGNFIEAAGDFIDTGKLEAIFKAGKQLY